MEIKTIAGVSIINEGRILLLQQGPGKTNEGLWGPPAGHGENLETLEETALRETKEESGLDVKLTGIVEAGLFRANDGNNYLIVIYSAESKKLEVMVDGREIVKFAWVSPDELSSGNYPLRHPILLPILLKALNEKPHPMDIFRDIKIKI